jgi:hypothetical protein
MDGEIQPQPIRNPISTGIGQGSLSEKSRSPLSQRVEPTTQESIGSDSQSLEGSPASEENFAQSVRILSEAMKKHVKAKAEAGAFSDTASGKTDWAEAFRAAREADGLQPGDREAIDRFLSRQKLGNAYGPGVKPNSGGAWLNVEA